MNRFFEYNVVICDTDKCEQWEGRVRGTGQLGAYRVSIRRKGDITLLSRSCPRVYSMCRKKVAEQCQQYGYKGVELGLALFYWCWADNPVAIRFFTEFFAGVEGDCYEMRYLGYYPKYPFYDEPDHCRVAVKKSVFNGPCEIAYRPARELKFIELTVPWLSYDTNRDLLVAVDIGDIKKDLVYSTLPKESCQMGHIIRVCGEHLGADLYSFEGYYYSISGPDDDLFVKKVGRYEEEV